MATGGILGIVTLLMYSDSRNNFVNYEPRPESGSYYYYLNSTYDSKPVPVAYEKFFYDSVAFLKCCPPGYLYEAEHRDCVKAEKVSEIYEEMTISVNLIKYGLHTSQCTTWTDHFIQKKNLNRSGGYGTLRINRTDVFDFCIDKIKGNDKDYVIKLCQPDDYCFNNTNTEKNWCIRKCCPDTYSLVDNLCTQTPKMGLDVEKYKEKFERTDGYGFFCNNKTCESNDWFDLRQLDFTLYTNGSLFRHDESKKYNITEYCLDTRYNTNTESYTEIVAMCISDKFTNVKWMVLKVIVIITCICFGITIAVFIFVYKLRKMVEKILTCLCAINLIFFMLYALRMNHIKFGSFCRSFGYIYFFFMISRLSWLNVLAYEIWQTLGRTRTKVGETRDVLRKKFAYFCIYAIMVPFFCTLFFILGGQQIIYLAKTIRPYVDPLGCALDTTLYENYGHYLFLYLPVWILIAINLGFYVKTVTHFLKIKRDLKKISRSNTNKKRKEVKRSSNNGVIILKLGLIMGITWIYYIYDYVTSLKYMNTFFLQVIGDILRFSNVLEGFFYLLIFVVKWKTVKATLYKSKIIKKQEATSSTSTTSTGSLAVSTNNSTTTTNTMPMETLST